jgi:hypothetical protein
MVFPLVTESSSWLPSTLYAKVDDAQDGSWRGSFEVSLCLAAKPSHVRVGVDGLAYPLHHPMACRCQARR